MFRAAQKEGFKPREARAMAALEPAFMRGFAPVFGLPRKGELEKLGNKRKRKAARKILTRRVVRWAKQADW
jgi:crotonobetainyl-CoA:carnitine CoA-transferase CaiB-like acyl-CoA transferase